MPSFPRYKSQGTLTSQSPSPAAPASREGEITNELAKAGQAATEFAGKWGAAYSEAQKTQAELNQRTQLDDILSRAEADPDYNAYEKYAKEADKITKESLQGVKSPFTKGEARAKANYYQAAVNTKLQGIFRKKMIDNQQANVLRKIDLEVANPSENTLGTIKQLLDQQVKLGFMTAEDAYKLERKANNDLGENRLNQDLYEASTPEEVDAVTQNITSGVYEQGGVTIDPEKKRAFLDIADRARENTRKKLEAQAKDRLVNNRISTITDIASGKVAFGDLDMTEIAAFDPELAGVLTNVKEFMVDYDPKTPVEEQPLAGAGLTTTSQQLEMRSYANSVRDVFLKNDNESVSQFMLRELEKKSDGLSPSIKTAAFVNLAALKARQNNPQGPEDIESSNRLNAIKQAVTFISESNPYLAPSAIGDFVVKNYLSGASEPEAVMNEARNTLNSKIIERYKKVAGLPSMPNKIIDGDSPVENLHVGSNELNGERYKQPQE